MKRFFPWPGLIFLFIGANVVICAATVTLATRAGDRGVEPKYYEKALEWEATASVRARSVELGWRVEFVGVPRVGQPLRVRVVDAGGTPLPGASVRLETFHHATASKRFEIAFQHEEGSSEGVYAAAFAPDRVGTWEFRWRVDAQGEEFRAAVTARVADAPAAPTSGASTARAESDA
jgi:hypothetical protein